MVFNNKGKFFLNLDEKSPAAPAKVAPIAAAPARDTKKAPAKQEAAVAATTTTAAATATRKSYSLWTMACRLAASAFWATPVLTAAEQLQLHWIVRTRCCLAVHACRAAKPSS